MCNGLVFTLFIVCEMHDNKGFRLSNNLFFLFLNLGILFMVRIEVACMCMLWMFFK